MASEADTIVKVCGGLDQGVVRSKRRSLWRRLRIELAGGGLEELVRKKICVGSDILGRLEFDCLCGKFQH